MIKKSWEKELRGTEELFGISVDDYDSECAWEQQLAAEVHRRKPERLKNGSVFAKNDS